MYILTDPECLQMIGIYIASTVAGAVVINWLFDRWDARDRQQREQCDG